MNMKKVGYILSTLTTETVIHFSYPSIPVLLQGPYLISGKLNYSYGQTLESLGLKYLGHNNKHYTTPQLALIVFIFICY